MSEMRNIKCGVQLFVRTVIALLIAIVGLAQGMPEGPEFHQSYDLIPKGAISIANTSGAIRFTSWDESRVQVDAIKRGRAAEFDQVQIQVRATRDRIEIQTVTPRGRNVNVSVDYDLKVPRTAILDPIATGSGDIVLMGPVERVNGSTRSGNLMVTKIEDTAVLSTRSGNVTARAIRGELRAESFSGEVVAETIGGRLSAISHTGGVRATDVQEEVTVSTQSGSIRLDKVGGRAIARSISGSVSIRDARGDVQAETLSDSVTVTDAAGHVNARSVSGDLILRSIGHGVRAVSVKGSVELTDVRGRIEATTTSGTLGLSRIDSPGISAKTVSGEVRFAGSLGPDGHYEFESFSGNVILYLPSDSQFSVNARSHSDTINTEFPMMMRPDVPSSPNRGQYNGMVGKGGAVIRASTFSGSIYLRKSIHP